MCLILIVKRQQVKVGYAGEAIVEMLARTALWVTLPTCSAIPVYEIASRTVGSTGSFK